MGPDDSRAGQEAFRIPLLQKRFQAIGLNPGDIRMKETLLIRPDGLKFVENLPEGPRVVEERY